MGVYKRGAVCWISYSGPSGLVRESTHQGDVRVAARMERERRREVALGTWKPTTSRTDARVTVGDYAAIWLARLEERQVATLRSYRQRYADHVDPTLGHRVLADIRPRDVIAFVSALKRSDLAPRTVHHVYDVLRSLCRDAVIDEVIVATPCVLPPKTLPKKRDKDPTWRAHAVYTRDEVETLISSELVAEDRRVYYALLFLLGCRPGEAVGRRWEDLDTVARPLGRMLIATQHDGRETKTLAPREMPVHPTLAAILARWRLEGWARWYGRPPRQSDLIIPSRLSPERVRDTQTTWAGLQADLDRLELRRRRQHDGRRTFVSLARIDGARPDVLETCTHAAKGDVFALYTSWDWATKCAEVAKLRIGERGRALVHSLVHSAEVADAERLTAVGDSTLPGEGLEPATVPPALAERRRIRAITAAKSRAKSRSK